MRPIFLFFPQRRRSAVGGAIVLGPVCVIFLFLSFLTLGCAMQEKNQNAPAVSENQQNKSTAENGWQGSQQKHSAPANQTPIVVPKQNAPIEIAKPYPFANVSMQKPKGQNSTMMVMDEFVSFGCAVCNKSVDTVDAAVKKYPRWLSVRMRHYPLPQTPGAYLAAEAFECAADWGGEWRMERGLYAMSPNFEKQALVALAEKQGLNATLFADCLDSGAKKAVIEADLKEVERLGLKGTPDFFLGNYSALYLKDREEFLADIGNELWLSYNKTRKGAD